MNSAAPPEERRYRVDAGQVGMRIDRFVKERLGGLSRREILRGFEEHGVLCNGRPARKGMLLGEGDWVEIRIPVGAPEIGVIPEPDLPLRILWEDPAVAAVDKAAGVATHPLHAGERGTLVNALIARYPEMEAVGFSRREPGILHRLDRDTSGVLLAARTASAFERLRGEFEQGRVAKVYFAVVHGRPEPEGLVSRPLAGRGRRGRRVEVLQSRAEGRGLRGCIPAETRYRVIRYYRGCALIRLNMTTGARHQLRAHMAFIGHPVVGDSIYGTEAGGRLPGPGPGRHLLHAAELGFFHPVQGRSIRIRSPMPADMRSFLKGLGRT